MPSKSGKCWDVLTAVGTRPDHMSLRRSPALIKASESSAEVLMAPAFPADGKHCSVF